MSVPTVGQVIQLIESLYPPALAESWDRVGLIVGGRNRPVRKILLAVDPVPATVGEALRGGFDLLLTHHPLYLRGTSFVSEDDPKGRMVADLIRGDCALYNAHTNADVAPDGVAEALARLVGLAELRPLVPSAVEGVGAGRIGRVKEQSLRDFAARVADALPAAPQGLLVGGDPDAMVETVAVSGGAGDSYLEAARRAGADVFLTADLRHHPASEHLLWGTPALLCGSHWATEWPWLDHLATTLRRALAPEHDSLTVEVSTLVTEPWAMHLQTKGSLR